MKHFFTLFLMAVCIQSNAQKEYVFEEVVTVDSSLSKKEIFNRVLQFLAVNYRDSKEVIQYKDEESGRIMGKGLFKFITKRPGESGGVNGYIWHIITIDAKDGKYRVRIDGFDHEPLNDLYKVFAINDSKTMPKNSMNFRASVSWRTKVWTDMQKTVIEDSRSTMDQLKSFIQKPEGKNW